MNTAITSYQTLLNLVDSDNNDHRIKELTQLFIHAITNWPNYPTDIGKFISEIKEYFGNPLLVENIQNKQFNGSNAWQITTGSSLIELIQLSGKYLNETNFDAIVDRLLSYYETNNIHSMHLN